MPAWDSAGHDIRSDTTLPAGVYGTWVNADTVVTKHEFDGPDGPEVFVQTVLYRHLVLTDSTLEDITVQEDEDWGATAYLFATPYGVEDGRLVLEGDSITVDLVLEADTLTLSVARDKNAPPPQRYVRAEPSTVPEELVGSWVGGSADGAGIVAEIRFTFREDGSMVTPLNQGSLRYQVIGPYFLLEDPNRPPFDDRSLILRVGQVEVRDDRLYLKGLEDDALIMSRVSDRDR